MEQFTAVSENDKIGGLYSCLCHIVYLKPSSFVCGRLYSRLGISKYIVEKTCSYAHAVLIIYKVYKLKESSGPLPGERRDEYDRSIRHFQSEPGVQVYTESYDVHNMRATHLLREVLTPEGRLLQREASDMAYYDTASAIWHCTGYSLRTIDADGRETLTSKGSCDVDLHIVPSDLDLLSQRIETMNTPTLVRHIGREKIRGTGTVGEAQIELWQRLLNPLAIIVMTFIGVAISSRKSRGGIGMHLAIGITLAFGFIVFMKVTTVFATNGSMSPFMAVMLPQLVFGTAAVYLIHIAPK